MALLFLTWLKNRFSRTLHLWNTSHYLIPITDEPTKVVTLELDAKEILKGICSTVFDVGTKVLMHHQQYLATPYISLFGSFSLFVGVYLSSEIACQGVGEC